MKLHFKHLIVWILLVSMPIFLDAQEEKYFDPQPQNFMAQLKTLFKLSARDELDILYKNLEQAYKSGQISESQQEKMVDILNIMYSRKMQVYPYYKNFIEASIYAHKAGYEEEFLDKWYSYMKGILKNAKTGQHKDFNIFVDFSNDLFSKNCLVSDNSKNWMIDSKDLQFSFIDGKTYIKVMKTNIKGYFKFDTLTIYNTSGVFCVNDKDWKGKTGLISWSRIGNANANATFSNYRIDMNKNEFEIDSVKLTYPEFFPQPIYGRLRDRITKEFDSTTVDYPQFFSYDKNFEFNKNIASNVKCKGGFILKGRKIAVGSEADDYVTLEIYAKDNKTKIFSALGRSALFERGKYVMMNESKVNLYAKNDSISHPFCQFKYEIEKRELRVNQENFGSGKSRFRSSFHKMSFDTEMLIWNIDEDEIKLKNLVGKGKNASKFVSDNNFDQNTYNLARTASTSDPLSMLTKMNEASPNGVSVEEFARKMGPAFSVSSVLPILFSLEKDGFLKYDPSTKTVKVNGEYAKFYMQANAKKVDYDIIRFSGYGENYVGVYNIKNNKIFANRVAKIPFNDSSQVFAFPYDTSKVVINNNRLIDFDGKIFAGRMDIYGKDFNFNYDSFHIKSNQIERMKINIPDKVDPTTGEDISLKPLKSHLDSFKGSLQINSRFNRSGMQSARKYPSLTTTSNSYVYYNHPNVFGGIYDKKKFYFEVAPFKKDSFQYFVADALAFDGKLYSHDIFNVFPEKLRVQKDLSLGFVTQTPATGFNTYKGLGTFNGEVSLSNQGLVGKGTQTHQSLTLESDSILYFPERTSLRAEKVSMTERKTPTELPQMDADSILVDWEPYKDTLLMASPRKNPFNMFNKSTEMNGLLILTDKGLFGKGYLEFPEAKIASNQMVFKSTIMTADTSSMEIKSIGDKVTFKTPNVRTKMDFIKKIGEFKSNASDISTVFAENKYKAEINEFTWDMNRKILTFTSPPGSVGSLFTSIHPDQDSLKYYAKKAEYNMVSSIIKIDGVEEIRIADSRVIPNDGKVIVYPDAKLETFQNATIEGDTTNIWHVFDKCKLDINGKNDMIGYGEYTLLVNNQKHTIKLNSIRTVKKEVGVDKKRRSIFNYTLEGKGRVDQGQNLKIYRNTDFYGEVSIFTNRKYPHFSGKQRILFEAPAYKTPWFEVDNEINVEELSLVKKELKTDDGKDLFTGFMVNRSTSEDATKGLYTAIMKEKNAEEDQLLMDCRGVISHEATNNQYVFGDSAKIYAKAPRGNKIIYKDSAGIIKAEGKFNPQLQMGGIPINLGGEIDNNMLDNKYQFKVSAGINLTLDPRLLMTLGNLILAEFGENKDVAFNATLMKKQFNEIFHPRDLDKFDQDIQKSGTVMTPPKYSPFNIVLSGLQMEFDKEDLCYRSKAEFGLVNLGGVMVNKVMNGFFEMGYGEYQDFFNLYFKAKNKEWIYITYADGILGLVSSNDNFNNMLNAIDQKKRYVRKNEKEYYKYVLADNYQADEFYKRMKGGGKFSPEEKQKAFEFEKPAVDEKALKEAQKFEESTPDLEQIKRENAYQDSILQEMERKIASEEAQAEKLEEEKRKAKKLQMEQDLENAKKSNIESPVEEETPAAPFQETPTEAPKEETPAPTETPAETPKDTPTETPAEGEENKTERNTEPEKAPEKKEEPASLFDKYF